MLLCSSMITARIVDKVIDTFYSDIINCLQKAVQDVIRGQEYSCSEHNMSGWNSFVHDKHDTTRAAFLDWVAVGKRKFDDEFVLMQNHTFTGWSTDGPASRICSRSRSRSKFT